MLHDLAIEEHDLNRSTIVPGGLATATFTVPRVETEYARTYHSGMTGRIDIG